MIPCNDITDNTACKVYFGFDQLSHETVRLVSFVSPSREGGWPGPQISQPVLRELATRVRRVSGQGSCGRWLERGWLAAGATDIMVSN